MIPRIALAAFATLVLVALPATAQDPPASPRATLADVAWLTGYWDGEGMGGTVEDLWMPPRAGVMLGSFRLVKPAGQPGGFYELFAIEESEGTLRFVAKHFHTDWVGWEEKDKALRLRLTRKADGELAFGGLVFRREGPDALTVELAMRGRDGASRTEVMRFKRRALAPS
jgi:hypothetical protein